ITPSRHMIDSTSSSTCCSLNRRQLTISTLFPYTTLFRSSRYGSKQSVEVRLMSKMCKFLMIFLEKFSAGNDGKLTNTVHYNLPIRNRTVLYSVCKNNRFLSTEDGILYILPEYIFF